MSLQSNLLSVFKDIGDGTEFVGASAFTQARAKLNGDVFLALNKTVTNAFYEECPYKTRLGHRTFAVDGSDMYLPHNKETEKHFGLIPTRNGKGHEGGYVGGKFSLLYDLCNCLPVDAIMSVAKTSERVLAQHHLAHLKLGDLVMFDRGYASFWLFAYMMSLGIDFVCRCSKQFCKTVCPELFDPNSNVKSKIIELKKPKDTPHIKGFRCPKKTNIRFVQVVLSTGECEVLATILLDEEKYPNACFGELYHMRRKIETVYDVIKNTLEVENFSGKTVASIYQDVYVSVLFKTFETLFTIEANEELEKKFLGKKTKVVA